MQVGKNRLKNPERGTEKKKNPKEAALTRLKTDASGYSMGMRFSQ